MHTHIKPKKKITSYIMIALYYLLVFVIAYINIIELPKGFDGIICSIALLGFLFIACMQISEVFFEKLELVDGKIKYYDILKFYEMELSSNNIECVSLARHSYRGVPFKILEVKYYYHYKPYKKTFQVYDNHDMSYLAQSFMKNINMNNEEIIIKRKWFPGLIILLLHVAIWSCIQIYIVSLII